MADRPGSDPDEPVAEEPLHPLVAAARGTLIEAIVGQSPVGVGVFDADARYLALNPALLEIIGRPERELLGERIEDAVGGDLGAAAGRRLREVLAKGRPVLNAELTGQTPGSGGPRTFQVSYFRLEDEHGEVLGAASLVSDITAARATRQALTAANARLQTPGPRDPGAQRLPGRRADPAQLCRPGRADVRRPLHRRPGRGGRRRTSCRAGQRPRDRARGRGLDSRRAGGAAIPPDIPVAQVLAGGAAQLTQFDPERWTSTHWRRRSAPRRTRGRSGCARC